MAGGCPLGELGECSNGRTVRNGLFSAGAGLWAIAAAALYAYGGNPLDAMLEDDGNRFGDPAESST